MIRYPLVEQDGRFASVSVEREPTGRWHAWVTLERDGDFARLKASTAQPVRVPNNYPSEAKALEAAYAHAHTLIAHETQRTTLQ